MTEKCPLALIFLGEICMWVAFFFGWFNVQSRFRCMRFWLLAYWSRYSWTDKMPPDDGTCIYTVRHLVCHFGLIRLIRAFTHTYCAVALRRSHNHSCVVFQCVRFSSATRWASLLTYKRFLRFNQLHITW